MKKLFTLLLLLTSMLSAGAQDMPTIDIHYAGATAKVSIPSSIQDVTATVSGASVTLNSATEATEYRYHVSGSTTDGRLYIIGNYKLTLELDNTSITSQTGAALTVSCGKRIAVILKDGTTNTFVDAASGTQTAAVYFTGHPEFEGKGTLKSRAIRSTP